MVQGAFLIISLRYLPKGNRQANTILSYLIAIATFALFFRLLYSHLYTESWFRRLAEFADTFIFLFAPLLYLYTRQLLYTSDSKELFVSKWAWIPAGLHFVGALLLSVQHTRQIRIWYQDGFLAYYYIGVELFGILWLFLYLYKCVRIVHSYQEDKNEQLSFDSHVRFFLYFIVGVLGLLGFGWLLGLLSRPSTFHLSILSFSYDLVWILIVFFMYGIGFYSLQQPQLFRIPKKMPKGEKRAPVRLSEKDTLALIEKLNTTVEKKKLYLRSDLTLTQLSEELGTTPNNVSWLLNTVYQQNFYDYINMYRVREFIAKLEKGEHKQQTLLALSMDSGFRSKSTFNKAFKNETNETPSTFIKKLKLTG